MHITVRDDSLVIGEHFQINFQRTLRVPDDGRTYPLPPGFGRFPVVAVEDLPGAGADVPAEWKGPHAFIVPMYQREALWIGFGNRWPPVAVKVAIGRVNVISGRPESDGLHASPQDYVVCPDQLWLDGINTGPATVRQFLAMPLGTGHTVEAAITGKEEYGGIQLTVFPPKPGATLAPPREAPAKGPARAMAPGRMGLGAGGQIAQKIYPDPHGVEVWDTTAATAIAIHLVNSVQYRALTGREAPPTPIDAAAYTARGLPWFVLYEEARGDVDAPAVFTEIKTVADRDRETGDAHDDARVDVNPLQVRPVKGPDPRH